MCSFSIFGRFTHHSRVKDTPFSDQGMAMVPALLLMAMLAAAMLPFLDISYQDTALSQRTQIEAKLLAQSYELAAFSALQLRIGQAIPEGLHSSPPDAEMEKLVSACQHRLDFIAPKIFTKDKLDSGIFSYQPVTSRTEQITQTSFFKAVEKLHGRISFIIISCSFFDNGHGQTAIAGFAAEHLLQDGSWHITQHFSL